MNPVRLFLAVIVMMIVSIILLISYVIAVPTSSTVVSTQLRNDQRQASDPFITKGKLPSYEQK